MLKIKIRVDLNLDANALRKSNIQIRIFLIQLFIKLKLN